MKLVSVAQMAEIERQADSRGLSFSQMMENAGAGLARVLERLVGDRSPDIVALVGPGNNGGDALVALSVLAGKGWHARAYLVRRSPDDLTARLEGAGGKTIPAEGDLESELLRSWFRTGTIVLDGLLGTGSKPPVRGQIADVLGIAHKVLADLDSPPEIVAVDCPSGIDCDTGEVSPECLPADHTVTMAAVKHGLLKMPAYEYVGELRVVDIGLPADLPALREAGTDVVDDRSVARILPERSPTSHKGTFGTAVIAAGSVNYTGAALLAGAAAYRIGAGLVTLAIPSELHAVLAGRLPEATWLLLPQEMGVISRDAAELLLQGLASASAFLLGPGLGLESTTADFVTRLLKSAMKSSKLGSQMGFEVAGRAKAADPLNKLPQTVVDADGLKLLARIPGWERLLPDQSVLTPHPGEMAILTGLPKDEIQASRSELASKYAVKWGHVVILKGAFTVIAAPDGQIALIPVATAALARAAPATCSPAYLSVFLPREYPHSRLPSRVRGSMPTRGCTPRPGWGMRLRSWPVMFWIRFPR